MTKLTEELFDVVDRASKFTLGQSRIEDVVRALCEKYVLIGREGLPEVDTNHPHAPAHAYVDGSTYHWYKDIEEDIIDDCERELAVLAYIQDGNNVGE